MTYQAAHVNQFHDEHGKSWGTPQDHGNCWAAVGAMAADFATLGKKKLSPPQFRIISGNKQLGGFPSDVATGLTALGIVVQRPHSGASWNTVQAKRANGWGVVMATDYDQIPDAKSCQPNFDGDHMLWLPPDNSATGASPADDPLCNNTKNYQDAIIRAAGRKVADKFSYSGMMVVFVKQEAVVVPPPVDPRDAHIATLTQQVALLNDRINALGDKIAAAIADLS